MFMPVYGILILFNSGGALFNKYEKDTWYITPNINAGKKHSDDKVILFGYRDLLYSFQRFYDDYFLVNDLVDAFDKEADLNNMGEYDYIIHLTELDSDEDYVEQRLNTDVEFVNKEGIVNIYKIT